jgi:hypothetical protein
MDDICDRIFTLNPSCDILFFEFRIAKSLSPDEYAEREIDRRQGKMLAPGTQ